jgi:potassium-transporting ATPase KdpC subunit
MRTVANYLRQASAAVRMLVVFTVVLGVIYPLAITAVAQLPGLKSRADGSLVTRNGAAVGSSLIGQGFTDKHGDPLPQYFQTRPSAGSYDPTASGASNLGPESIVDAPDEPSLLTQVCTRSLAIGKLYGVDGSRPYCTTDGVGSVLAVFHAGPGYHGAVTRSVSVNQACPATPFIATYRGAPVECAAKGGDYATGQLVPVRGDAPAHPAVPADAVTASGSGLDPDISPSYAKLQEAVVARARGVSVGQVAAVVAKYESGRTLGFLGEPRVNVLKLNLALDRQYPL